MSTTLEAPNASTAAPSRPQFLWNEIVRWTLEACILRKEGKETEVGSVLQERLPALIREWSACAALSSEVSKERLRSLFKRVQESVETGFIHRRLIVEEICSRLTAEQPAAFTPTRALKTDSVRLRRRVAIDDVPGMLDAVAEAELEIRSEAMLPMRRAASSLSHLFSGEIASPLVLSA